MQLIRPGFEVTSRPAEVDHQGGFSVRHRPMVLMLMIVQANSTEKVIRTAGPRGSSKRLSEQPNHANHVLVRNVLSVYSRISLISHTRHFVCCHCCESGRRRAAVGNRCLRKRNWKGLDVGMGAGGLHGHPHPRQVGPGA